MPESLRSQSTAPCAVSLALTFDRDLIRGGHYGQRSYEPRQKAGHMAAPTNAAKREENPCQPGAVHTDLGLSSDPWVKLNSALVWSRTRSYKGSNRCIEHYVSERKLIRKIGRAVCSTDRIRRRFSRLSALLPNEKPSKQPGNRRPPS
jgi:hypothetical protein